MKGKVYEKDKYGITYENGKIVRIPAKNDYMFKNLFGVNGKEENLKGLLQAILKIKIDSLEIENSELPRDNKEAKLGVVDVKAKLSDGTIATIEMQVKNEKNIGERITFYICKIYFNDIKKKQDYKQINKVIAIAIIDFSYFNRKEYHQIAHLKFEECKDENEIVSSILEGKEDEYITDKIEVHIIDLKKFKKMKNPKGELADWLNLILGNEGAIEMAIQRNADIARVNEENKELSEAEDWAQFLRDVAKYDENTRISYAIEEKEKDIAKKMLKKGIAIKDIQELIELSKEEIEKLEKEE